MRQVKECIIYSVGKHDNLSDILRRFDISIKDLEEYNKACDILSLKEGQILFIKNTPDDTKSGYILQQDENLWSVAKKFKVSTLSLLKANPNFMPQEIKQGIRIALPDLSCD